MSQTDSRQVLQVVDFNQATSFFKNNTSEEYKVQGPALNMPLSVTPLHASSSDARRTAKAKFQEVLKYRVSEDPTGDLADTGVREWSLDDFEYICTLGSGATATVYRAREKISGYEIALKVQEYDDHDTAADVELDIHSNLDHPNTVKLIDYFFSDVPFEEPCCSDDGDDDEGDMDIQNQYFCMILEICDKGSLFDVIESYEGGWLDEVDAARYMKGCLRALKYLHENDLIHCDVKTANFLVDSNDQIKLADFGMTVRKNEIEVLGGSPVFMAPEHLLAWRCGGENFDHRVDIYGLGVTLFQILVGDFPFYVIQNDEDNKNADSLLACFGKLTMGDGPIGFNPSRLDLRPLYTDSAKSPLYMPTISFPDQMSEEARDLIRKLMEPNPENRISISDALNHPWFQCVM